VIEERESEYYGSTISNQNKIIKQRSPDFNARRDSRNDERTPKFKKNDLESEPSITKEGKRSKGSDKDDKNCVIF
jgi:hypothetical protein